MNYCENCRKLNREIGEKTARVLDLEQELATCQDYLRTQTSRSEKEIKRIEKHVILLQNQLDASHSKVEALLAENRKLNLKIQEANFEYQEISKNNDRHVAIETEYEKKIRDMEIEKDKENEGIRANQKKTIDNSTIEMLIERVQLLEGSSKTQTPLASISMTSEPNDLSLEEQSFQMKETMFTLEAYDPISQVDQLLDSFVEMEQDGDEIDQIREKVADFKQQFLNYMTVLGNNIHFLSLKVLPNPKLSEVKPLPEFPNSIDTDFLSQFETTIKQMKKPTAVAKPVVKIENDLTCSICSLEIGNGPDIASCSGCQKKYHKECGRVFAEAKLNCTSDECGTSFEGSQWL